MIKIGLVDDHQLIRKGLSSIINQFHECKVVLEAAHDKDLITQLKAQPLPDIILLDISMPVMDGFKTAEWLKQNHPKQKILALSVHDDDTSVIKMLKIGVNGYILKDESPDQLEQAIYDVIEKDFYMNELVSSKMYLINSDIPSPPLASKLPDNFLTPREKKFLIHICNDLSHKEIADLMKISPRTVDGIRDKLLNKIGAKSRVGLVIFAIKYGIYKVG